MAPSKVIMRFAAWPLAQHKECQQIPPECATLRVVRVLSRRNPQLHPRSIQLMVVQRAEMRRSSWAPSSPAPSPHRESVQPVLCAAPYIGFGICVFRGRTTGFRGQCLERSDGRHAMRSAAAFALALGALAACRGKRRLLGRRRISRSSTLAPNTGSLVSKFAK